MECKNCHDPSKKTMVIHTGGGRDGLFVPTHLPGPNGFSHLSEHGDERNE